VRETQQKLKIYKINVIRKLMNYFLFMIPELKKPKLTKTVSLFISVELHPKLTH